MTLSNRLKSALSALAALNQSTKEAVEIDHLGAGAGKQGRFFVRGRVHFLPAFKL
ncbi:hypothetical protein [Mesorhizobium sp. M0482]|uniref:hypothetical protein n=1 Tax=Mesorhizobium sp. M0482 TaxID=2956948 RepID=UPI00333627D4